MAENLDSSTQRCCSQSEPPWRLLTTIITGGELSMLHQYVCYCLASCRLLLAETTGFWFGEMIMKRIILMSAALAASLWLSGCTAITYEHYRHPGHPHAVYAPPHEVVQVIEVPPAHPRGHRGRRPPVPWR